MHIDMQSSPNERFREFYQGYQDETGRHIYVEQVQKMSLEGLTSLVVNYDDLLRYDPELARLLRENPEETMKAADDALFEVMKIEDPMYAASDEIFHARFSNIPDVVDSKRQLQKHGCTEARIVQACQPYIDYNAVCKNLDHTQHHLSKTKPDHIWQKNRYNVEWVCEEYITNPTLISIKGVSVRSFFLSECQYIGY